MNVSLTQPLALLLLALIPLVWWAGRRSLRAVPVPRAGTYGGPGWGTRLVAALPGALRLLSLLALIFALAGPVSAGAIVEERSEGVPIVLAIDISSSMLAQDFRPRDRLTVAKMTTVRFIEAREADPIGLVAFAGEALTLVPATTHRTILLNSLRSLQIGLLEDGTAIGDGLAAAVNRLRHFQSAEGVIVLLSDGENNRGTVDPLAAADAAAVLGVRVFTIGVGSEGVAPVPIGSAPAGFRYAELAVGLDEDLLRGIAERTGGRYFRATDPDALERIYEEIDRLVPSVVETTRHVETNNWAAPLLLVAGLTLLLEWGVRASPRGALP